MSESLYGDEPYNGELPRCHTVAQLREVLAQLPGKLPLSPDEGVEPAWCNVGSTDAGIDGEHLFIPEYPYHDLDEKPSTKITEKERSLWENVRRLVKQLDDASANYELKALLIITEKMYETIRKLSRFQTQNDGEAV